MYNRISDRSGGEYARVEDPMTLPNPAYGRREHERPPEREPERERKRESEHERGLFGSGGGGIGGLLRSLRVDLDTGDILMLLIILFLYMESDDHEIIILLALILLMGLGG